MEYNYFVYLCAGSFDNVDHVEGGQLTHRSCKGSQNVDLLKFYSYMH
jgi:hypothetical protein